MRPNAFRYHERGVVLVLALLLIVAGTVVAIAAMTNSDIEMMISGNQKSQEQLFDVAEAGIDDGIRAFFTDAPPWGAFRPPITSPPTRSPWGVPHTQKLSNEYRCELAITDMEVSKAPPPGNDPGRYKTFYYRIVSKGLEQYQGPNVPQGVRETEQVVGVTYKIK
jgi:hypothetical protein